MRIIFAQILIHKMQEIAAIFKFNGIKYGKNKLKQAETTTLAALKYLYKKFKQLLM